MRWDAIIVGGRCAGSPTARFLARAGKRVLLIDAAKFPSDQPLSTHFIQPYGMRILDELGLGDRVREIAPPVVRLTESLDDKDVRLNVPLGGCCPRRTDLDAVLLEGAHEAGAEVRLQHRVVDVLRAGTRIDGVVVEDRQGTKTELRSDSHHQQIPSDTAADLRAWSVCRRRPTGGGLGLHGHGFRDRQLCDPSSATRPTLTARRRGS